MKKNTFETLKMNEIIQGNIMQTKIYNNRYLLCLLRSIGWSRILFFVTILMLIEETTAQYCQNYGESKQCRICGDSQILYNYTYYGEKLSYSQWLDKCCEFVSSQKYFQDSCDRKIDSGLLFSIIFGSVCGVIIVIVIVVWIVSCCINNSQAEEIPNLQIGMNPQGVNPQIILPNSAQNLIFQEIQSKQLPEFQNKQNNIKTFLMNPTEICSICLQKSTQIMTSCNHYFHIDCFGKWLNKNNRCPLCNGLEDRFNPVIIYCRQCNYRVLGVKIDRNKGNIDILLQKYKQTVCSACKE